jgi:tRNA(adenine34) deaminase
MPATNAEEDLGYMREALTLAQHAASKGEVPVGAIAVKEGVVVGRGYNRRELDQDPFSHAELLAMREAAKTLGVWRLSGVTIYVTLEPCSMCAGAMVLARISRLVFAAADPKAGAVGSLFNLVGDARLNHQVPVTAGVMGEESSALLKGFFKALRDNK